MPIYEFKCKKCGKKFEELLYGSDCFKVVCPECGTDKPEKLMSGFGVKMVGNRKCASVGSSCCAGAGGCKHAKQSGCAL